MHRHNAQATGNRQQVMRFTAPQANSYINFHEALPPKFDQELPQRTEGRTNLISCLSRLINLTSVAWKACMQ
jgi:hypothetical protein